MAIFELKEKRFYERIMFFQGPSMDIMAAAYRDLPDGTWEITWRFRYYNDTKVHDSEDHKSVWRAQLKDLGTQSIEKHVDDWIEVLLIAMGRLGIKLVSNLTPRTDDPDVITDLLARQPWAHLKHGGDA